MTARARRKKSALTSGASFHSVQLYLCWVMICPVTTSRPTQTQGHTHHDTVESVWLGSRSARQGAEGKAPKRDWCLCPYRCPSSSALFPSVYPSPAHLWPSLSSPHVRPSVTIPAPVSCGRLCPSLCAPFSIYANHACFERDSTKWGSLRNLTGVPSSVREQTDWPRGLF